MEEKKYRAALENALRNYENLREALGKYASRLLISYIEILNEYREGKRGERSLREAGLLQ